MLCLLSKAREAGRQDGSSRVTAIRREVIGFRERDSGHHREVLCAFLPTSALPTKSWRHTRTILQEPSAVQRRQPACAENLHRFPVIAGENRVIQVPQTKLNRSKRQDVDIADLDGTIPAT